MQLVGKAGACPTVGNGSERCTVFQFVCLVFQNLVHARRYMRLVFLSFSATAKTLTMSSGATLQSSALWHMGVSGT